MTIHDVTVGIGGSPDSEALLRWADDISGRAGGSLRAVTAWHLPYMAGSGDAIGVAPPIVEVESQMQQDLANLVQAAARRSRVEAVVAQGGSGQVLIDISRDDDLLVVGRRGVGGLRALGSTSRHCAIHAGCPVAVVPTGTPLLGESPRLAVAVDGSPSSAAVLAWAAGNFPGSEVTVVNSEARGDPPAADVLAATVEASGVDNTVSTVALSGDPRSTVLDVAADADALIVGDRGHGGVIGLILGSFATYAVGHAPAPLPVIVVRSGG
jgi:nucleotide-binding universal stress UspA family protein